MSLFLVWDEDRGVSACQALSVLSCAEAAPLFSRLELPSSCFFGHSYCTHMQPAKNFHKSLYLLASLPTLLSFFCFFFVCFLLLLFFILVRLLFRFHQYQGGNRDNLKIISSFSFGDKKSLYQRKNKSPLLFKNRKSFSLSGSLTYIPENQ